MWRNNRDRRFIRRFVSTSTEGVATFRNLPEDVSLENIDIPASPENRRPTNVNFLRALLISILVLLPPLIYTLYYADISRMIVGYDDCGNVCGKKNYKWAGIDCSGQDFTDYPYLEEFEYQYAGEGDNENLTYTRIRKHCVQSCNEGYTAIFGRCSVSNQKDDLMFELSVYFLSVKWQLTISCLLSALIAMGMLFLFRSSVAFMVWGILIGTLLLQIVIGAVFLYFSDHSRQITSRHSRPDDFFFFGMFFILVAIIYAGMFIWFRKKIRLVILLLKETTKAVFDMPGLIAILVFSEFVILSLTSIFFTTSFYIASSGTLQKTVYAESYSYVGGAGVIFTFLLNTFVYVWLTQFFFGIQYIIIAGAAAKWYFARDKRYLGSPIVTSISNAFKFHLGSVAMGSLIMIIVRCICSRSTNENRRSFLGMSCLGDTCRDLSVELIKYVTKNSYIVTAIHGQAFFKSGKRAAKLLIQNFGDMVALNYIGDTVLFVAMLMCVLISGLLSFGIFAVAPGPTPPVRLAYIPFVAVFAFVFAFIAFGVFEPVIDTIFICYCEDKLLNDGIARPYFMSRNLMEFIQKSKESYRLSDYVDNRPGRAEQT